MKVVLAALLVARAAAARPADDDVSNAPVPGTESGRTDIVDDGDGAGREIARAALFPVKLLFLIATAPPRAAIWANDKYHLDDWYYRIFYFRDRTVGIIPSAEYITGFGFAAGARFLDLDLFGSRERLTVDALAGGAFQERAAIWLDSGHRFDRVSIGIGANFDRRPADPFYGIGNGDLGARPAMLVDPRVDPTAFLTEYRYEEKRANAGVDVDVASKLHAVARGAVTELAYGPSTLGTSSDAVYDSMALPGFLGGVRDLYGELELRWDGRRPGDAWDPPNVHAAGEYASVFAGREHRLDGGQDFWHVGFEAQYFLRLGDGPRVLSYRALGEAVSGGRGVVPFSELPYLGGDILRGYPFARFRDRVSLFGSLAYQWDISHNADAYLFVDHGRVFDAVDQLSIHDWRVGYGIGVALHDESGGFLLEASLATSIDGGMFISVAFNPILDVRPRWR